MFRINSNVISMFSQRTLAWNGKDLDTRMERLSTGLRINHASDDPAGLTASETLRAQIAGQKTADANISRAMTLLQTADSSLSQIGDILIRLKELAEQSADGTLSDSNRSGLSTEADQLVSEIERIASTTTYNGISLIDSAGTLSSRTNLTFYVGDGTGATTGAMVVGFALKGVTFTTGGLGSIGDTAFNFTLADFLGQASAQALVEPLDQATTTLATIRTDVGAFQNRLERSQSNLQAAIENSTNSLSTIRDADFALEASAMTRAQILAQTGVSMLSQANLLPQLALNLVQGL